MRTPVQDSGGSALPANDCSGAYTFHFSQSYMLGQSLSAGTTMSARITLALMHLGAAAVLIPTLRRIG